MQEYWIKDYEHKTLTMCLEVKENLAVHRRSPKAFIPRTLSADIQKKKAVYKKRFFLFKLAWFLDFIK